LVFLGAGLLWFGWFGFNAGSAGAANMLAIHAFMTTAVSAAAALLSWLLLETLTTGKPTLVGASTAWLLGSLPSPGPALSRSDHLLSSACWPAPSATFSSA
jgi:ammonia channel protein AmtB